MKTTALALSVAAAALAAAPAPAQVPASQAPVTSAAPAVPTVQPQPPARWTREQIQQAFQQADLNGDGQLTRAEAQRLPVMPRSFEDADTNKDGVLTLDEYIASFAPS